MITPDIFTDKIVKALLFGALKKKNPMTLRATFSTYLSMIHLIIYKEMNSDFLKRRVGSFTREDDLALFYRIKKEPNPKNIDSVPLTLLMPSFIVSELRTAFEIGFLIFLPFLVIDIIVSSILMSLGMMMLPPVMISLPIKIIFFIVIDGWQLIIGNVAQSFK